MKNEKNNEIKRANEFNKDNDKRTEDIANKMKELIDEVENEPVVQNANKLTEKRTEKAEARKSDSETTTTKKPQK